MYMKPSDISVICMKQPSDIDEAPEQRTRTLPSHKEQTPWLLLLLAAVILCLVLIVTSSVTH
jgi:hypothetical protein